MRGVPRVLIGSSVMGVVIPLVLLVLVRLIRLLPPPVSVVASMVVMFPGTVLWPTSLMLAGIGESAIGPHLKLYAMAIGLNVVVYVVVGCVVFGIRGLVRVRPESSQGGGHDRDPGGKP